MKVLGISSSPRKKGNTDLLLDEVLRGAHSQGAIVEKIFLPELNIHPCRECNHCFKEGECALQDDMRGLLHKMREFPRLAFASPIFFMAHCAQAKIVIDRCQVLWARKYVLKLPLYQDPLLPPRRGLFISVGGSRGERMFEGAKVTMKYLFDALEMEYWGNLLYQKVEEKGEILSHPRAMEEAFLKGRELAQ